MITQEQINLLSKKKKINKTIIFREYLQLLFLSELYLKKESKYIFFKGGTALHLIYNSPRFSEDLDFTVIKYREKEFLKFINQFFKEFSRKELIYFKEKKSIAGRKFLLVAKPYILENETFINLDFSFREKVIMPQKSIIETDFPVLFSSYIYHLAPEEIFAEKIRAVLTRNKGRDLYDLWYLVSKGIKLDKNLVKEKLKYYHLKNIKRTDILEKIRNFSEKDFILDIRPFIPLNEREKLKEFFNYIKNYLEEKI